MKSPLIHLVFVCALLVVAVTGYAFWYVTTEAKSVVVARLENQIVTKTEIGDRISSVRASLAEIPGEEKIIQSYFVSDTEVVAFINSLEAQGHTQGTVVKVLSVSPSEGATPPALTLSLTVEGTFDAVMRTVGAIEYAPYDLSLSTLSVGHDEKSNWHADFTILVGSVSSKATTNTP